MYQVGRFQPLNFVIRIIIRNFAAQFAKIGILNFIFKDNVWNYR
jgi:hypothetical protein